MRVAKASPVLRRSVIACGVFEHGCALSREWVACLLVLLSLSLTPAFAQEYLLGPGDVIKVAVYQNPDLTTEARVSEVGTISFPLIGSVQVGGLTLSVVERKIAQQLKDGGFVLKPQVNILLTQAVGNQVAVLGQVNHPGRYPIETAGGHLSGMLSVAGGIAPDGADVVIVTGMRDGKPFRREIDIVTMFLYGNTTDDIALAGGDTLFVNRAPTFYIYGEVQHPGAFRLEKGMTIMQALAAGGGVTAKGTTRGIVVHRRDAGGKVREASVALDDGVQNADVIYIKESLF